MSQPIRLPVNAPSYSAAGANFFIDKTGAIYQTWLGRTAPGSDWGSHVYRTAPGAKPQLMFFQAGINGYLEVMNKELWFGYCDARQGHAGGFLLRRQCQGGGLAHIPEFPRDPGFTGRA